MNDPSSLFMLLLVLIPLAVLPLLYLARGNENLRENFSLFGSFFNLFVVISLYGASQRGALPELNLGYLLPNVPLSFQIDSLGFILLLTAAFLWPLATLYSAGYLRDHHEKNQTRFFSMFCVAIAATNGVAISSNLLTLYVFYEILSLSTYPLVTHHQDAEARSAGRRYLAFIMGGSVGLVLPALITVYVKAGNLTFGSVGLVLQQGGWSAALITLAFLYGFSKAAVMPMHAWLPGAMVAPTPVSSLLHAVAVVKVGVFSVIRSLCDVLGPAFLTEHHTRYLVTTLCTLTVVVSAALMVSQDNLKRCLAFSTIGQLSYILLAVSFFNKTGITGGCAHIFMHAFGKITLFFCAGAIAVHAHKKYISQFDGLGRSMPWTFGAFTLGCLAIIGLPPTGGFLSKWLIVTAALKAGMPLIAGFLLVSSLLKAWAFFPIIFRAFFAPAPKGEHLPEGDCGWLMRFPLLLTATGSVVLFFFPDPILRLAEAFAEQVLSRGGL
ncbi:MAG TPA: monovalent cation/H+ antiporter subunit D family protein [Phycisphaerales bacterium]|nr:monovalent cation/H+ antiporter subunit D family protein [Phycisphaerales bacterium]